MVATKCQIGNSHETDVMIKESENSETIFYADKTRTETGDQNPVRGKTVTILGKNNGKEMSNERRKRKSGLYLCKGHP